MKSFLTIGIGVWILLFALFLPFSYSFFPQLGFDLTSGLSNISEWIATRVLGVEIYSSPTTSDSTAQFVQAFLLAILAFIISFVLQKQPRFSDLQIKQFLHTSSAYILSFFLLKYGVDKLFQFQFYAPEPNTLFTPLGMLSKDILFWSSMGTSSSYNTFMGLSEVIPALLLLHHRTRLLGGLIASGVLINVLAINVGFDITVKLLSLFLVIVSIYVICPFLKNLFAFFIADQASVKPRRRISVQPKIRLVTKALVVLLLFTEILFSYASAGSFNGRSRAKIAHAGSYFVAGSNSTILDYENIKRIHIHSKGYLILENQDGNFIDFPIRIAPDQSIFIRKENAIIYVSHREPVVIFEIQKDGNTSSIITEKYNLDQLPARDDSFSWTVDGMLSRIK